MACSQDNVESLWDDGRDTIVNPNFAQKVPVEQGCRIDSASIRIMKDTSGSGTMRIRVATGVDPNNVTVQATSANVDIDDFPAFVNLDTGDPVTNIPLVKFSFSSPYTVQNRDDVWLLVERPSPTGNDPVARVYTDPSGDDFWTDFAGTYILSTNSELEYDLNGISEGTLYIENTGFRFPYQRWA